MNKEHIPVITDREELYDKCENMEQLYNKYYLPLLDIYYRKTYELQQDNKTLKEELKAVNKGLRKVLSKRKKWKYRYYKEKRKNSKAIKYIEDKIQKSFKADYGLEPFERTDRLFTETVVELQKIEQILDKGADK